MTVLRYWVPTLIELRFLAITWKPSFWYQAMACLLVAKVLREIVLTAFFDFICFIKASQNNAPNPCPRNSGFTMMRQIEAVVGFLITTSP